MKLAISHNTKTTDRTGDYNDTMMGTIGGCHVPFPMAPFDPIDIYRPVETLEQLSKWMTTTSVSSLTNFRQIINGDTVTYRCDVPGVKPEDLNIELDHGCLRLVAKRFDSNFTISDVIRVGDDWNLDTAEAELEYGVLNVTFKKREERKPRRISLKVK